MTGSISLAATKAKELQVTATIQPLLSPIVPSHGSGLRAVGGLICLIHAAKWGNNVTNYEQAHSPACGILPFVSLHHVSAGLLGRVGGTQGQGTSQLQEASPVLEPEPFTHLGTLPFLGTHSGASSLFGKTPILVVRKIEESDTSFFQVATHTALWQHTVFSLNIRINICGFGQLRQFLSW